MSSSPSPKKARAEAAASAAAAAAAPRREEEDDDAASASSALILEEQRVWRKNAPFLYDLVLERALPSTSQTLQWLPNVVRGGTGDDADRYQVLFGTQSSAADSNEEGDNNNNNGGEDYLLVANVLLPKEDTELDCKYFDEETGELGGYAKGRTKFEVVKRIPHDGDVERARCMPQDCILVASRMRGGDVGVFNLVKEPVMTASSGSPHQCTPEVRLVGHGNSGFGLDWSPLSRGKLVTCSPRDPRVLLWDVEAAQSASNGNGGVMPTDGLLRSFVFDCAYHGMKRDVIGTVSEQLPDRANSQAEMCVWDVRQSLDQPRSVSYVGKDVNCFRFSPLDENLAVSGGAAHVVHVWDLRKVDTPVHMLRGHTGEVYQVAWSPFHESVLASCGTDRRVIVWDLNRIGMEQAPEDAEDGDPELLFIHGGHSDTVTDVAWNEVDEWVAASVSADGVLQVWEPNDTVLGDDVDDDVVGGVALE